MARTGTFDNFYFDPDVFSEYMEEQPYIKNAIIQSGIIVEDATISSLLGEKGNVGTMPFYVPIDADVDKPKNYNGKTDNTASELQGGKQTFMAVGRMKAWQDKDFTRELTGARPLENVANKVNNYYQQVWQGVLMNTLKGVMGATGIENHITDISVTSGSIEDTNRITETSGIDLCAKACGDMADKFTLVIMHSVVFARLRKLQLIEYSKFVDASGIRDTVELPTWDGKIVVVDDRGTVDTTTPAFPVYKTYFAGTGAFLTTNKKLMNPYYIDYNAEKYGGVNLLYTKQARVLHPNGFSIVADSITDESPTDTELSTTTNWSLKYNEKNIALALLKSNG